MDKIIKNGQVVIPYQGVKRLDIGIKNGKIFCLGGNLEAAGAEIIDASGKYVFPGAIDGHSHYGVYGDQERLAKDYRITSRSSAIGGLTTVVNFMRSTRSYLDQLPEEKAIAEENSVVDFCFHLGIMTHEHLNEMDKYVNDLGNTSFKLFLGYKGLEKSRYGTDIVFDDELLLDIYDRMNSISRDLILLIHCENVEMGRYYKKKYNDVEDKDHLVYYDKYNPDIVETENIIRCSYLAKQFGTKMAVVHCSAKSSVDALEHLPWFDKELIHIETCPHYLLETVDNAKELGGIVKPPLRYKSDNDGLWEGIEKGIVSYIGTDHVSINWDEKFTKGYAIDKCALGFGGVEFMFPMVLSEGYYNRGLSLQKIAEITSANTAKTYNLYPKKGAIEIGSDADLILVDLELEKKITPETLPIFADWSLYEGRKVKGWPVMTLRRGEVIAADGSIVEGVGRGEYIKRSAKPVRA